MSSFDPGSLTNEQLQALMARLAAQNQLPAGVSYTPTATPTPTPPPVPPHNTIGSSAATPNYHMTTAAPAGYPYHPVGFSYLANGQAGSAATFPPPPLPPRPDNTLEEQPATNGVADSHVQPTYQPVTQPPPASTTPLYPAVQPQPVQEPRMAPVPVPTRPPVPPHHPHTILSLTPTPTPPVTVPPTVTPTQPSLGGFVLPPTGGVRPVAVNAGLVQAQMAKVRQERSVDVCFVVDCTGSMVHWLKQVKEKVLAIAAQVGQMERVSTLRLAFVGYRDYLYADRFTILPFTENMQSFYTQVQQAQATFCEGNDEPEDLLGGLDKALRLQWTASTRLIVLIADAPCHGRAFHDLDENDNAPFQDPLRADTLLTVMSRTYHIDLAFCRINATTDKMIKAFKGWYNDPGSRRLLRVLELDEKVDDFLNQMVQTISESVMRPGGA